MSTDGPFLHLQTCNCPDTRELKPRVMALFKKTKKRECERTLDQEKVPTVWLKERVRKDARSKESANSVAKQDAISQKIIKINMSCATVGKA